MDTITNGLELLIRERGSVRVLVVEDDDFNQEVAVELLAVVGVVADVAADGEVALAKVATGAYDLVLMDVQMPVMDGLEATRRIRALAAHAATPIIAMTANAFEDDREQCLAVGMDDYLAKPVAPDALYEKLLRWLAPGR
jgi:two-component system sensor histidine kinase/response regulator